MDPATKITLAIPTYNRYELVIQCIENVIDDERIGEVVLNDDFSTDGSYERLMGCFRKKEKVKIFQNEKNLDCHFNKARTVIRSSNPWVILFDDDNIISKRYLDTLYSLPEWHPHVAYCPTFAEPHFNYTAFSGEVISRRNLFRFVDRPHFLTALNTCNYFVHRDDYLKVWDGTVNPHTADSIYQNYRWLESGRLLHMVMGLRYFHRVHDGSHFKNNVHKTGDFARMIEDKLRKMR